MCRCRRRDVGGVGKTHGGMRNRRHADGGWICTGSLARRPRFCPARFRIGARIFAQSGVRRAFRANKPFLLPPSLITRRTSPKPSSDFRPPPLHGIPYPSKYRASLLQSHTPLSTKLLATPWSRARGILGIPARLMPRYGERFIIIARTYERPAVLVVDEFELLTLIVTPLVFFCVCNFCVLVPSRTARMSCPRVQRNMSGKVCRRRRQTCPVPTVPRILANPRSRCLPPVRKLGGNFRSSATGRQWIELTREIELEGTSGRR